jgi:hypothetical protein
MPPIVPLLAWLWSPTSPYFADWPAVITAPPQRCVAAVDGVNWAES